jgi:ketopantoate reductase
VRIEMASDIRSNIFDKLLINASLNTISTLTRTDCGQVVVRISARYYTDLFYR